MINFIKTFLVLIVVSGSFGCSHHHRHYSDVAENAENQACDTTKEYITALEFLRVEKNFAIAEPEARKLALEVSKGCSGSAERFIRIVKLLVKAEVGSKDAIQAGLKFAGKTEIEADAFVSIFKTSFVADSLDLDLATSIDLAHSLSSGFDGDHKVALKDFYHLVGFCLDYEGIDLPRPACAKMAARIARTTKVHKQSVYHSFKEAYMFMSTSGKGPHMDNGQATRKAEELVAIAPRAVDNYIVAYRYAVAEKGLGMSVPDALSFADKMAKETNLETKKQK
ncbi:MAG: hypothetical protein AB7F43_02860 [Bacteriovoracia bacterium]